MNWPMTPKPRDGGEEPDATAIRASRPTSRPRLALALALAAFAALAPATAAADPPAPVYNQLLGDCVTGNNQFYQASTDTFAWWVNQSDNADGSAADGHKCDKHAVDQYERPT